MQRIVCVCLKNLSRDFVFASTRGGSRRAGKHLLHPCRTRRRLYTDVGAPTVSHTPPVPPVELIARLPHIYPTLRECLERDTHKKVGSAASVCIIIIFFFPSTLSTKYIKRNRTRLRPIRLTSRLLNERKFLPLLF